MGYQGRMHKSRSNFKGGYHQRGSFPTVSEPDSRFYRRHGRYSELRTRTNSRKAALMRKQSENPRLVRFHFLHHDL